MCYKVEIGVKGYNNVKPIVFVIYAENIPEAVRIAMRLARRESLTIIDQFVSNTKKYLYINVMTFNTRAKHNVVDSNVFTIEVEITEGSTKESLTEIAYSRAKNLLYVVNASEYLEDEDSNT